MAVILFTLPTLTSRTCSGCCRHLGYRIDGNRDAMQASRTNGRCPAFPRSLLPRHLPPSLSAAFLSSFLSLLIVTSHMYFVGHPVWTRAMTPRNLRRTFLDDDTALRKAMRALISRSKYASGRPKIISGCRVRLWAMTVEKGYVSFYCRHQGLCGLERRYFNLVFFFLAPAHRA